MKLEIPVRARRLRWLHAVLLSLVSAPAAFDDSVSAQSVPAATAPTFRVGDAVRITVWGYGELSGEFDIAEDGTIIHPLYREIRISGMSLANAEDEVKRVVKRFETDPELVLEPLFRISVGGEVRSPNVYSLPPHTTATHAIARAGGTTLQAAKRARLLRGGQEYAIDLTQPHIELEGLRLRSGDQLIVDRRKNVWHDYMSPALSVAGSLASITLAVMRVSSGRR